MTPEEFLQQLAAHRGQYGLYSDGMIRHITTDGICAPACPIVHELGTEMSRNSDAWSIASCEELPYQFVDEFIDAVDNNLSGETTNPDKVATLRHRILTDLALWPWNEL